jgi:EAL domain-containing protein (putative c-di-GMP-specific phosphodiesterase class I)
VETVIESLVASVHRHTEVDVAYLTEYDSDAVTVRVLAGDGHPAGLVVGHRVSAHESLCLASVTGQAPAVVADTSRYPHSRRLAAAARDGIGAFAAVPVHLPDGRLYGALCIAHHRPVPHLGSPTQQFLAAISDVVADQLRATPGPAPGPDGERRAVLELLEDGHMSTLLQPIVDLAEGRTIGVEALTRFTVQPHRPPDLWFSIAARHGLGDDLELAAVERASALTGRLPACWYLSVNASPAVVAAGRLGDVLPLDGSLPLVVEVTEHAAVSDYDGLVAALDDLRARGVRVAVDDVGAGFSSFRHVLQLRPDLLKVDRSLVRGLGEDPMHRAMVESIVRFAEHAGLHVVAEAVETPTQLAVLQELGVPSGQGYLFAAPGDPEDLRSGYPVRVPARR